MRPAESLKRHLPSYSQLSDWGIPGYLAHRLRDPQLWKLNRYSVSKGVAIGLFCAYLPMPFETLPAILAALACRANLPISITLVWISNPFTWIPLWAPPYLLGSWLIGEPAIPITSITMSGLSYHLYALWLGCLIFAALAAILGYFMVRLVWRLSVSHLWRHRMQSRQNRRVTQTER